MFTKARIAQRLLWPARHAWGAYTHVKPHEYYFLKNSLVKLYRWCTVIMPISSSLFLLVLISIVKKLAIIVAVKMASGFPGSHVVISILLISYAVT